MFGVAPGIAGGPGAGEVIKLVTGSGDPVTNGYLTFSGGPRRWVCCSPSARCPGRSSAWGRPVGGDGQPGHPAGNTHMALAAFMVTGFVIAGVYAVALSFWALRADRTRLC